MDKFLNVAVVTLPFSDLAGEAILGNYIDLLEPLANEIYVITGKFSDRPNKKIHITRLDAYIGKKKLVLVRILKFLITQLKISYHLLKISRNVDAVIFQIGTRLYLLPILLAKLLRKKVVIVATGRVSISAKTEFGKTLGGVGGLIFPLIFRTLENVNFSLADQITVLSKSGIGTLDLSRYGKKITISGAQYINTNIYRIKKEPRDRKDLVGYIGNLGRRKGVLNFIEAIPLVLRERNDVEFLVGGSGPLADTIKQELGKNNLHSKVKLVGWIFQEQLPDQLNELKLFILASYVEGLPAIVQQAMACGAVVLATPVGGIPDLIKDGETGFILEDNSPECIAKNVIMALNAPNIEKITRNARALIEKEYTYEAVMERLNKSLGRLASLR